MEKLVLETVQYSKLTHIDEIEPINERDFEVLNEIKSILVKHNYTDRFGVTLIHKHFDLAEDEVLMETTDEEARVSIINVQKSSGTEMNTIETTWKFALDIRAETICVLKCHYFLGHKRKHVKVGV